MRPKAFVVRFSPAGWWMGTRRGCFRRPARWILVLLANAGRSAVAPGEGPSGQWRLESGLPAQRHDDLARCFERRLSGSGQFQYSLQGEDRDTSMDAIEDFVSNHRRGHCEYFATALALMLRSQGIPSRVVLGYRCDEWHEDQIATRSASCTPTLGSRPFLIPGTFPTNSGGAAGPLEVRRLAAARSDARRRGRQQGGRCGPVGRLARPLARHRAILGPVYRRYGSQAAARVGLRADFTGNPQRDRKNNESPLVA